MLQRRAYTVAGLDLAGRAGIARHAAALDAGGPRPWPSRASPAATSRRYLDDAAACQDEACAELGADYRLLTGRRPLQPSCA